MLERLELRNFKSFQEATVPLGPLTLVVGTNASGKSNLRDALRFRHGREQQNVQVIGTTHNPALLAFLDRDVRKAALLVVREEGERTSRVIPIVDLPDLNRILDTQDLGRLHAAGWLEDAAFRAALGA